MIIWINGAFGAGKTTTAYELHRRVENSFVYDPENVGYFLRKNMPPECCTEDFQDMALWRSFNYQILKELDKGYNGAIIVPMTLVNPSYYEEVIQRLMDEGAPVLHFILYASRKTILKRLKKRSFGWLNRESFAVEAIDRCIDFFDRHEAGIRIETDSLSVDQIVAQIGEKSGLTLLQDERGKVVRISDQIKTVIQHIRF